MRNPKLPLELNKTHETINILGHGRKRRQIDGLNTTEFTKFKENIEYTVLMPGELGQDVKFSDTTEHCKNFVMISGLLAGLLALSTIITCGLASKLQYNGKRMLDDYGTKGYAGRAIVQ